MDIVNIFNKSNRTYENEGISRLIKQSFAQPWSIEKDICWGQEIIIPQSVDKESYLDMVSQLYYTEEFIINMGAKLVAAIPDLLAKQYITIQLAEESKHALAYKKYIEIIGEIKPINRELEAIFTTCFNYQEHFSAIIVALNVVMEGEAVGQQKLRIRTLPCPIFKQINSYIIKDEARHAAFGILYMKDIITTLDEKKICDILKFIKKIWELWDQANKNRYDNKGDEMLKTSNAELELRLFEMKKRLKQIGITYLEN